MNNIVFSFIWNVSVLFGVLGFSTSSHAVLCFACVGEDRLSVKSMLPSGSCHGTGTHTPGGEHVSSSPGGGAHNAYHFDLDSGTVDNFPNSWGSIKAHSKCATCHFYIKKHAVQNGAFSLGIFDYFTGKVGLFMRTKVPNETSPPPSTSPSLLGRVSCYEEVEMGAGLDSSLGIQGRQDIGFMFETDILHPPFSPTRSSTCVFLFEHMFMFLHCFMLPKSQHLFLP